MRKLPNALCGCVMAACLACSETELPPLPEALVVVDTDAQVPKLVDRLRVDFYQADGTWFDSRDIARRSVRDWPASFSVYGESEDAPITVLLRLRGYRDGKVRDYRGERFQERPLAGDPGEIVSAPPPPVGEGPRLHRDGRDVTPKTEPLPNLTIDRLVRVDVPPRVRGSMRIVLRGACFGTMANLEDRTTCVDTENERAPVGTEPVVDDMTLPSASTTVNQFGAPVPCDLTPRSATVAPDGTPFYDEEVCVPGGAYMLGSSDVTGIVLFEALESIPERVAVMPPLLVDKYEVTVGRWRRARLEGFLPVYDPNQNAADTPLPAPGVPPGQNFCTYSNAPLVLHSREAYPVNCVGWDDARAFCQYMGGDLLTEAQWEYIATGTADYGETLYPWGNDPPSCATQVYSREYPGDFCYPDAYGPALPGAGSGDVTPLGVRDLGGSMAEWVLDSPHRFDARCWASIGLHDPRCWEEDAVKRPMRGGGWGTGRALLASLRPSPQEPHLVSEGLGFRCARSGAEPSP